VQCDLIPYLVSFLSGGRMGRSIPLNKKATFKGGANQPASKAKLGSGGRFKALKNTLAHEGGVSNPGALAAAIGRKKFGKKKFQGLAAKGRRKH
jgi:hypothetical protein